jgi:hypothetical protein
VALTLPPEGDNCNVEENELVADKDSSKLAGAANVTIDVRPEPETAKLWLPDTPPTKALKAPRLPDSVTEVDWHRPTMVHG